MIDMVRSLTNRRAETAVSGERGVSCMSNTTIPCVLNGRASLLATVPATTLAGIIAADIHTCTVKHTQILTHTHKLYAHTTKEIAHLKRFEFVKGYFSHYNKK